MIRRISLTILAVTLLAGSAVAGAPVDASISKCIPTTTELLVGTMLIRNGIALMHMPTGSNRWP